MTSEHENEKKTVSIMNTGKDRKSTVFLNEPCYSNYCEQHDPTTATGVTVTFASMQ
jgi:hypothetical protein